MHAPSHHWTALFLIATLFVSVGCRGSRPFNRFVQVTQGADAEAAEIEAPPQRLATAKARAGAAASDAETSPHVTTSVTAESSAARIAANAGATTSKSARPEQQTALQTAAEARESQQASSRRRSATRPTASQHDVAATATPPTNSASETSETSNSLSQADVKALAEIREQVRPRGEPTSNTPDQTTQPNPVDEQLVKSVDNPPELPAARNTPPEVPPARIAVEETDSGMQFTVSDRPQTEPQDEQASQADESDDAELVATGVDEMPVQKIPDSVSEAENNVKPASAARPDNDGAMIAQAAVEPGSVQYGDAGLADFTTDQLYAELFNRHAAGSPGESEADRESRLIHARYVKLLQGDLDAAVDPIEGMSEAQQEFLRHNMLGVWTIVDPEGHPVSSRRITSAVSHIREAAKFAAAATDSLDLQSLAFCTEVISFGQIKPFSGNRFEAGQQVILYCQIDNRAVKETEQGFETHLQGHYEIYNEKDEKVLSQALPADQQFSDVYLQDYFTAYQMHLPQLPPGTYRMQLTVEDVPGKKYGQASIPFEIAK